MMRRSAIWMLAGVMVFAFWGLLYLQINYVRIILNTQEAQFEDAVRRSLYQVSYNLELDETKQYLAEQIFTFNRKSLHKKPFVPQVTPPELTSTIETHVRGLSSSFGKNNINTASMHIQMVLEDRYFYQQNLLERVIKNALKASEKPIEERIDFPDLEKNIHTELANNNLTAPFVFAVLNRNRQVIYNGQGYDPDNLKYVYSQMLFPKDIGSNLYTLQVAFPTQHQYMLDSIGFIIPSVGFTLVLLIVFVSTIYILLRQKKLTEIKNDFINNMTHELKTPVAGISLAAQTLSDAEVNQSPQLLEHAKQVISDESKRLVFLVDKVLQMSLFDNQAIQFKKSKLDANDLIASVASTVALHVEKVGGTIDVDLGAMDSTIAVDKMHFTNVLFNLMENAIKYRKPKMPLELMARTKNVGDKIQITIEDNGIGIKKEDTKRIFDRFYRAHTGNLHDVKGFGLGLAYVKRIITELDGSIKAVSEIGAGTKFIIQLPITNE